jgi:CheY-like chemotaxis protein
MRWRPKSRERLATGYKRVDDATAFLELANKILNPDRQIFLAYDAQQAFQLIRHLGGAAALVDLDLKGKDGLSLMQKLRERFPALPVVAISRVLGVP